MTTLTRFQINIARRAAWTLLASRQRMHAAVMAAFNADDHAAADHRPLWRLDRTAKATWLYLLSSDTPDLTHLAEQAGWPTKPTWESRSYDLFLDSLAAGQRWAFRLTANPSFVVTDDRGRKKIHSHMTPHHQLKWLLERAERVGVAFPPSSAGDTDVVVHDAMTHRFDRGNVGVVIRSATYDGNIDIVDPDALRLAIRNGIGRSKAYGCGLLTLARP